MIGHAALHTSVQLAQMALGEQAPVDDYAQDVKRLRDRFSHRFLEGCAHPFALSPPSEPMMESEALIRQHCSDLAEVILPLGKGGLYQGLWDISLACKCGLSVEVSRIPIMQGTLEILDFLGENPYKVSSHGAFLLTTPLPIEVVDVMREIGCCSSYIGTLTKAKLRKIFMEGEEHHIQKPTRIERSRYYDFAV